MHRNTDYKTMTSKNFLGLLNNKKGGKMINKINDSIKYNYINKGVLLFN